MPATDDVILRVDRVSRTFGETRALDEVSLEIRRGEVVALVGPSGSGKSTLVRCIQQLETIDQGSIFIGDQLLGFTQTPRGLRPLSPSHVARQRRLVSMVFQNFQLFPHMTAGRNIAEAPVRFGMWSRAEAPARATALLEQFELGHKAESYPAQLSGGQQQRVAIARALALEPQLLMLDEPTSALDPASVGGVERVVAELAATGTTMLIVTHQVDFAQRAASRFVRMADGRVTAQGAIDQLVATIDDVPTGPPVDTRTLATRRRRGQ